MYKNEFGQSAVPESKDISSPSELELSLTSDNKDGIDPDIFDASVGIGKKFLEGMAMGSNISLEQKMALKAMEAIINNMADNLTVASTTQPVTSETAAGSSMLDGIKGLFS